MFKDTNLPIVRLTPAQYNQTCSSLTSILSSHYDDVSIPPSAPGKPSHGDIDVLVLPLPSSSPLIKITELATHLNASAHITNGPQMHFALPLADYTTTSDHSADSISNTETEGGETVKENAHFQVDINICTSRQHFTWYNFRYSYNSLFSLLGAMGKPYGLSLHESGLSICVAEFDNTPWSRPSRVPVVEMDADAIFKILELDVAAYHAGFDTLEALFDWLTASPLFYQGTFLEPDEKEEKAQDKKRRERWMEKQFMTVYLPARPHLGLKSDSNDANARRNEITEKLTEQFDLEQKFKRTLLTFRIQESVEQMWRDVAKGVPKEGEELGEVIKVLREWWKKNKEKVGVYQGAEDMIRDWEKIVAEKRLRQASGTVKKEG